MVHPLTFCPADPETTAVARLSRAEAYTALKQYRLALEDTEFCYGSESLQNGSAEVGDSLTLILKNINVFFFLDYYPLRHVATMNMT